MLVGQRRRRKPDDSEYELAPEPARETGRAFCKLCGQWRGGITCHTCGVDLDTGDLLMPPSDSDVALSDSDELDPENLPQLTEAELAAALPFGVDAHGENPTAYKAPIEYGPRDVPESAPELLIRGFKEALQGYVAPVTYLPLCVLPLGFQRIPWANEAFPWPGQALATFVVAFALLERARSAREEASTLDIMEMGGNLWRTLVFMFPVLLGAGTAVHGSVPGLIAFAVLLLLLPLFLGAMATHSWGEVSPKGLWISAKVTPNLLTMTVLSSGCFAAAMAAIWAFPDGNSLYRGTIAALGASLCGALAGASRLDAEIDE